VRTERRIHLAPIRRAGREQLRDAAADLVGGHDVVGLEGREHAGGHGRDDRIVRGLHHRPAAQGADRAHARDAIVQRPREDDGHDVAVARQRGAPEQDVHGRTMEVLARPADDPDGPVLHEQVAVRRGHEDPAGRDGLAVLGVLGRQGAGSLEDRRQLARPVRADVQDDQHCGRKLRRQLAHESEEGFHTAGRSADDDEIAGQGMSPSRHGRHGDEQGLRYSEASFAPSGAGLRP
jgi:hypothetical protein